MRCEKCGGPITNSLTNINGINLCGNCAKEMGIGDAFSGPSGLFNQAFPLFSDLQSTIMGGMGDLEFSNNKIRCPRCGSTLRDIESTRRLGCIECYNTFNETLIKDILKRQGSDEYLGRKPGEKVEITIAEEKPVVEVDINQTEEPKVEEAKVEEINKEEPKQQEASKPDLKQMDLSTIPTDDLKEAMQIAVNEEDYAFAAKIRDEINSRKEDN